MNEKSKLIEIFQKVKSSAEEAREDSISVQADQRLTDKGKAEDRAEIRRLFSEACKMYRDEMIKIVNDREADYTAYYVKVAKDRFGSSSYMETLMSNIKALEMGYLGKIEILALMELYKDNDHAMSMVMDAMRKIKSPYIGLIPERITINMQLNAFENIRKVIQSKINANLLDVSARYSGKTSYSFENYGTTLDNSAAYFGSGYFAIVNELNENLSLISADASLGKIGSNNKDVIHNGKGIIDMINDSKTRRLNTAKDPKPAINKRLSGSSGHTPV